LLDTIPALMMEHNHHSSTPLLAADQQFLQKTLQHGRRLTRDYKKMVLIPVPARMVPGLDMAN